MLLQVEEEKAVLKRAHGRPEIGLLAIEQSQSVFPSWMGLAKAFERGGPCLLAHGIEGLGHAGFIRIAGGNGVTQAMEVGFDLLVAAESQGQERRVSLAILEMIFTQVG